MEKENTVCESMDNDTVFEGEVEDDRKILAGNELKSGISNFIRNSSINVKLEGWPAAVAVATLSTSTAYVIVKVVSKQAS